MSSRHRRSYSSSFQDDDKSVRGSYVTIACTFCKKRHFKCDGHPDGCTNCSKRGQECIYIQPTQKRGPKRKKGSPSKRAKLSSNHSHNHDNDVSSEDEIVTSVTHRSVTRSQTKPASSNVTTPATSSPNILESTNTQKNEQIINSFQESIDYVASIMMEGTISPFLDAECSGSEFSDFSFSVSPIDESDDLFSETNELFSSGSPLSSSPIDSTLLFSDDQPLFTNELLATTTSTVPTIISNVPQQVNRPIRLFPVTELVSLPETLFNNDLNGTMSPTQTIVAYLYIYQRSMDTFMPAVELPFLWDQRVRRVAGQFNGATRDDDVICLQFLNGDMETSLKKPVEELVDDIKVYVMLAVGARFCKRREEALQFLTVGRELLRIVYDHPFLQVGWVHLLLAQFYFGEGDIKNAAVSNSLALTCASCSRKDAGSDEQKSLLMGALVFSIILVKDRDERAKRIEKIRQMSPQPLQLSFANFFFLTEQLFDELRYGTKNANSLIPYLTEMESNFQSYILSPLHYFSDAAYRRMVGEIILYSIQGLVQLRDGNRTTALRLASQVSAMAKRLDYCCAGVPFASCFAAVVFQQLNVRNEDYYNLLQVIDKFSKIYPCLALILTSLNVPPEDISRARSGQFALIQPQHDTSSTSLWDRVGQQFLVDSFFNSTQ